ncbi:class I SAM-dependent methyltransferase [Tateyamaria sp. SN6-1]|uniref:class I SAM-dependent methyltransferase n=1 Tax=Tateyamaria sp. SN6-1 TaxID=3092148 RepID=UPI0039F5FEA5
MALEPQRAGQGYLGDTGTLHLARIDLPGIVPGPDAALVRAPNIQRTLALDADDRAFLDRFTGAQTAQTVVDAMQGARMSKYGSEMDMYLGVERFRALGLLVATRLLHPDDVRGLVVPATCACPDGPLAITRRPDGRWLAVAGTNAITAQRPVRAHVLDHCAALAQLASLPGEFFGSARGGIPYQSIFLDGTEHVPGRRPDLHDRFERIDLADIAGKRVLDLGCNIGMNCVHAAHLGAHRAVGFDLPEIVAAAERLNMFFDTPCRFVAQDLNVPPAHTGRFDTVFLFAVLGHLDTLDGVLSILAQAQPETVYVETHCDIQDQGQTEAFLNLPVFASVTPLGLNFDNAVRGTRSRQLFRCRIARSS